MSDRDWTSRFARRRFLKSIGALRGSGDDVGRSVHVHQEEQDP